jgi:hypothetical protein
MQHPGSEDKQAGGAAWPPLPAWIGAAAGAVACALLAFAFVAPRWHGAPASDELRAGLAAWHARWLDTALAAAGAGVVAALLGVRSPRRAGAAFAAGASAALAGGLVLLLRALPGAAWLDATAGGWYAAAAAAAVAAAAVRPFVRDGGGFSLVVVPVLAALPGLYAVRHAIACARAAAPHAVLQRAVAAAPAEGPIALLLPEPVDAATLLDWQRAVRPPFAPAARALWSVPAHGSEADWLRRLGVPGLEFDRRRAAWQRPVRANERLPRSPYDVQAGVDGGAARAVWCRAPGVLAPGRAVVLTPVGPFAFDVAAADARATFGAGDAERFGAAIAPVPPGLPIRVLVVSLREADAYGWVDVVLP